MVRIRVKITQHDGAPKREVLWQGLRKAKAFVYKIAQSREAFWLITDGEQAELILKDSIRDFYKERGLEVQIPPEYDSMRTLLMKGVEWYVSEKTELEIKTSIETDHPEWKLDRVVKIPSNDRLMKLVCANVRVANDIMEKGLVVLNQRFSGRSLEKEIYVNVTPCFKCYKFDHTTKKCEAPEEYKVCSSCSKQGHRFDGCKSTRLKCLNCGQSHKTLAFKCPKRKEYVKKKLIEMKQKKAEKEKVPESEIRAAVVKQMQEDLPRNYLTVVASAMTLATIRESECPGVYQYIVDEMYRANDLPVVKVPSTVITGYEHYAQRKRGRETSEEELIMEAGDEEGAVGGPVADLGDLSQYSISMQNLLKMSAEMPAPTPTPTPAQTPASTPAGTPAQSPERLEKSIRPKVAEPVKKKGKKEEDPGVVLITYTGCNISDKRLSHSARVDYLLRAKALKYVYQNRQWNREVIKEHIMQKKIDLNNLEIYRVDRSQFDKVVMGQYLQLHMTKK